MPLAGGMSASPQLLHHSSFTANLPFRLTLQLATYPSLLPSFLATLDAGGKPVLSHFPLANHTLHTTPYHITPHQPQPSGSPDFLPHAVPAGLLPAWSQVPCPFGLSSCFYWDKVVAYLQPLSSVNGVGIAATLWQDYKLGAMAQFLVISS